MRKPTIEMMTNKMCTNIPNDETPIDPSAQDMNFECETRENLIDKEGEEIIFMDITNFRFGAYEG